MKSFIIKLCTCFKPKKHSHEPLITRTSNLKQRISKSRNVSVLNIPVEELKTNDSIDINLSSSINPISNYFLFSREQYREDEFSIIQYTKENIVSFIDKEFLSTTDYKEFFNKDKMVISMKEKTLLFTDKFPMIKMSYCIPRSLFAFPSLTIDQLISYINDRDKRLKWDKSLKEYQVIEHGQNNTFVLHSWLNSPILFISERDFVEKKINFFHDTQFYSFYSSVDDDYIPLKKNVERAVNYFNGYKIFADEQNFYIRSLSQMDLKVKLPQAMMNMAMPTQLKEWYSNLIKAVNEDMIKEINNSKTNKDDEKI